MFPVAVLQVLGPVGVPPLMLGVGLTVTEVVAAVEGQLPVVAVMITL
jgi:hypothetical protein